jgi:hypothetical protein
MIKEIVPNMEDEIQKTIDKLHDSLDLVNEVLCEKLVQEETRSDVMI